MVDTIKQRIALDGDSEVKKSLAEIGDVGERSFKKIDDASKQAAASIGALTKDRLSKIGISPEEFNKRTEAFKAQPGGSSPPGGPPPEGPPHGPRDSAEAIHRLREVLHVLHPVLAEAGIGFGELSGFMVAARGGAVALAASIGGALVTALEKAGDEANDAAARLGAFAGSTEKGREAFHSLQGTAGELRTPASDLIAPFEQLLRANQSSPTQASDKTLQDTLATFVKASQADRTDFSKAINGITGFFAGLKESGSLTPEAVTKLADEVSPTLAKQLLDDLTSRLPGKQSFSTQDVIQSTSNVAPQVNANLLKSQAEAAEAISRAWVAFKGAVEHLEETIGGGGAIAGALNTGADNLRAIADAIGKIIFIARNLKIPTEADLHPHKPTAEEIAKLPDVGSPLIPLSGEKYRPATGLPVQPDIPASSSFQRPEFRSTAADTGAASAAERVEQHGAASEHAASAVEKLGAASEGAQGSINKFAEGANKLQIISSELSKRQSELDLKYEPSEAASRLAKGQISVQNADIHLAQAKISGLEAQKNKDLAALAPETARENVADAAASRDKALSNFLKNRGVDTSALDALNAQGEDSRALDRAETALKRAQIEKKYAYLEPQKAELNAQQTETAIRSAEIEKNDSSLKLAKDSEGAPLAHELSQLRYAQASLDELKLTSKYGEATVNKLDEILNALTKNADKQQRTERETTSDQAAQGRNIGNEQTAAGDQVRPTQAPGSKLLDNGVVNIPRGASQDNNNDALKQQAAPTAPGTKQDLEKEFDGQIQELKRDWRSQSDFSEQIGRQNGGVQKLAPDEFNPSYLPPVYGHYDPRTQQFIAPGNNNYDFAPKNNDYQFGGKTNPAGPYQPGISAPLSFPDYNKQLMDSLPDNVPLPQPRPPEADQQSALPQQFAGLGDAISKLVETISAAATQASDRSKLDQGGQPSSGLGIRGEAEPSADEAPKELSELGDDAGAAGDKLSGLGDAVDSVVARLAAAQPSDSGGSVGAATGGHITGPGTSTSDSIPAMLSHNEYVQNARAVEHYGVPFMDAVNNRTLKFAKGGLADFHDHVAALGLGGTLDIPHLAVGGMPEISMPTLSKSIMGSANATGTDAIPVDLRITDHGTVRASVDRDGLSQLRRAAVRRNMGKGPQPSWVG